MDFGIPGRARFAPFRQSPLSIRARRRSFLLHSVGFGFRRSTFAAAVEFVRHVAYRFAQAPPGDWYTLFCAAVSLFQFLLAIRVGIGLLSMVSFCLRGGFACPNYRLVNCVGIGFGGGFPAACAMVSGVQMAGRRAVLVLLSWCLFRSFCIRGGAVSLVPLVGAYCWLAWSKFGQEARRAKKTTRV